MPNIRHTTFNDQRIAFQVEGKGPALVLLHGFLEEMAIWKRFSKELSQKYKVILIDLPGHGQSEILAEKHEMELMAEVVNALLNYLQVEQCVMIGHSMGGYVSLAFADKYPDRLNGVGVFHSHALADTTEAKINRGRAIQVVKDNHKDFISSFIPDLFTSKNQTKLAHEIAELQNSSRKMSKEAVIAALDGMRHRTDKLKVLSTIRVPVLFIIGKQDPRTPLEKMWQQIALPKHAEVLILDEVAHMGYLEAFDQTLAFVDHFVDVCNPAK
jgi:pimeloyl-ACP methyl ester carboxylesterase